ncbi:MAG TPA: sulfur oxidation c-type cytochrome SoxX [Chromatiales bacterium]|nr:sulfur oxidation c-type cytochrome SoxX [Chromatiales bacterium]
MNSISRWAVGLLCCLFLTSEFAIGQTPVPNSAPLEKYCDWSAKDYAISKPLCGLKGNAERGRKLAINRKKGNCLACHVMPISEEDFHGTIAPPLVGVGARYNAGQIRVRIVDIKQINPASLMPSFYKHPDNLNRVAKKFQGRPPLTAQETEDIVAYLETLK